MRGVVREGPGRGQCAETRVTSWSRRTGLGTLCARGGRTAVSKAPSARARAAGSGPAGGGSRAPGVQDLWEQPAARGPAAPRSPGSTWGCIYSKGVADLGGLSRGVMQCNYIVAGLLCGEWEWGRAGEEARKATGSLVI